MITVLTGGTGGAKFVWGLAQAVPADQLTVIVNTGDDLTWWGLHVSPDLDSVMYALAGKLSHERGWGYADDSFRCLERMCSLGAPGWFQLGDLDLATHLRRTEMLRAGMTLSEATAELCRQMGVHVQLLPMTDDAVETRVITPESDLSFQEYFVRDRFQPEVMAVKFRGTEKARTAPGVLEAITRADIVFIAPSNPVSSIGPILAVPGVRDVLRSTTAQIAAISPIVGGAAVSGPAGKMMSMRGWKVSPGGVFEAYRDFVDVVIADQQDEPTHVEDVHIAFTNTIMKSDEDKTNLARFALDAVNATREAAR
jgi:LPPG:FO 2-phospho-L-lactate transferase